MYGAEIGWREDYAMKVTHQSRCRTRLMTHGQHMSAQRIEINHVKELLICAHKEAFI